MISEDKAADIKKEEQSNSTINSAQDDVQNKHHEADETKEDMIRLNNNENEEKDINSDGQEEKKADISEKLNGHEVITSDNKSTQNESEASNADDTVMNTETINKKGEEVPINILNNDKETHFNRPVLNLPDLEVPFSERRLAPETINLLNKPVDKKLAMSGIEFQFSKIIGVILKSKGLDYSEEFLSQMNDLSITYFHDIIEMLRKFTEVQRRKSLP